jgi:hypothetical protein
MHLTDKELILLTAIVKSQERIIDFSTITSNEDRLKSFTVLEKLGYLEKDEDSKRAWATKEGVSLVKIALSGLDFSELLKRQNNSAVVRLAHVLIQEMFKRNIHLNVVFKNLKEEDLEKVQAEINEARSKKQA